MGLRLAPPELEIGEDEGFADKKDIFGRKAFGQGLTNLVKAIEGPAVIALDAPWGAGKTTFLRQWCGDLKNNGIPSIRFDAFANDYKSDAFLALAAEIIGKAEELKVENDPAAKTFQRKAKEVFKSLLLPGFRIGTRALTAGAVELAEVGGTASTVLKSIKGEVTATLDEKIEKALTSTKRDEDLFGQFRDALGTLAKCLDEKMKPAPGYESGAGARGDAKLVFIIDELDRCRPDFALDILEKVKHFYNVPGVLFVLSVNMGQLAESVRSAYGHGINASTYLEKFYQWRVQFPNGKEAGAKLDEETYIRHILKTHFTDDSKTLYDNRIEAIIGRLSRIHNCSFRTIEHIVINSVVVIHTQPEYAEKLQPMAIVLCALKTLRHDLFDNARNGNLDWKDLKVFLKLEEWSTERSKIQTDYIESICKWACGEKLSEKDIATIGQNTLFLYGDDGSINAKHTCDCINGFAA